MAKLFEEFLREERIAILVSFSILNEYEHPSAFNMSGLEGDDLACPQSSGVSCHQNEAMFQVVMCVYDFPNFFLSENDREFSGPSLCVIRRIFLIVKHMVIQKLEAGNFSPYY